MLLRKFSQTFKVSLALLFATLSTGILPTATAFASHGTGRPQDVTVSEPIAWGQQGRENSDPSCEAGQTSLFHYVLTPSGTTLNAAGTINVTFTTGSDSDAGELSAGDGGSGHYYVSAPHNAAATAATVTGASWVTDNHNPQTPLLTLSGSECIGSATPTGSLNVSTDCEEITFSAGAITPTGGTITFTLDGISKDAGTYTVAQGEHTIVMSVNGTVVDTEVRTIAECQEGNPTGTLQVRTTCESISFRATDVMPARATVVFELDDTEMPAGTYEVTAGIHTVKLYVNGELVDRERVEVQPCEATPTGTLGVRVNCESITFRATAVQPSRATVTFELNGVEVEGGQHIVPAGEYTVDMYVNGTKVDTETRTIAECEPDKKTELCHATGSETNPYELIDVSVSAAFHGHLGDGNGDHQNGEDIIPPFEYRGNTYSQNWDEEGQAIYENDCVVPDDEPQPVADIDAVVICAANGALVTLTNSGDADGTATVNGTDYTVKANDSRQVTVPFDTGTPFIVDVTVTVGNTTVLTQNLNCTPGRGAGVVLGDTTTTGGQVLGTSTELPETLPATGGEANPFLIIIASLIAYGAAYFLQGRRQIGKNPTISA